MCSSDLFLFSLYNFTMAPRWWVCLFLFSVFAVALGPRFTDFFALSSSLQWHHGSGFAVLYGFWLGLVVNDLGFVVGWLWRFVGFGFVGFGLDRWF